jgi:hypothetical protein
MSEQEKKLDGPDFARGVPLEDLAEGSMILGQAAGEAVVLARAGGALFAIGAECTHYHGPLAEGMLVQPPSSMGSVPESRVRNDSPLEEDGFEPSVPPQKTAFFETAPNSATTNRPGSQRRF